eukprot:3232045-Pyramimonas_sp.AAC.1
MLAEFARNHLQCSCQHPTNTHAPFVGNIKLDRDSDVEDDDIDDSGNDADDENGVDYEADGDDTDGGI